MKAITISQPYASLIASGEKWVENRTWATSYRGPLAIHAGKGTQYLTRRQLADFTVGAIVATCDLVACVELDSIREDTTTECNQLEVVGISREQLLAHEHAEGPWCWVLSEMRIVSEPVRITGKQGLWDVPAELLRTAVDSLAF